MATRYCQICQARTGITAPSPTGEDRDEAPRCSECGTPYGTTGYED